MAAQRTDYIETGFGAVFDRFNQDVIERILVLFDTIGARIDASSSKTADSTNAARLFAMKSVITANNVVLSESRLQLANMATGIVARLYSRRSKLWSHDDASYRDDFGDSIMLVDSIASLGDSSSRLLSNLLLAHITHGNLTAFSTLFKSMHSRKIAPSASVLAASQAVLDISLASAITISPSSSSSFPLKDRNVIASILSDFVNCMPASQKQSDSIAARLHALCCYHQGFQLARQYFASIDFAKINDPKLTLVCYSRMIQATAKYTHDIAQVEALFTALESNFNIQIDRSTYICMMHCYITLGAASSIPRMFQKMVDSGYTPCGDAYSCLIYSHAFFGDVDGAFRILDKVSDHQMLITNRMFLLILLAYAKSDDLVAMEAAEAFYEQYVFGKRIYGVEFFNVILFGYLRRSNISRMTAWLNKLVEYGCQPDSYTFGILLKGLLGNQSSNMTEERRVAFERDFEAVTGVPADDVRNSDSDATELRYRLQTFGSRDVIDWFQTSMIDNGPAPGLKTYIAIFEEYAKDKNYHKVFSLLGVLRDQGYQPNTKVYDLLIKTCAELPDGHTQAFELYNTMTKSQISPNPNIYFTLIRLCLAKRDADGLYSIIRESTTNRAVPFQSSFYMRILGPLLQHHDWSPSIFAILMVLDDLVNRSLRISKPVIVDFAQTAVEHRNVALAAVVAEAAMCFEVEPSRLPCDMVLKILCLTLPDTQIAIWRPRSGQAPYLPPEELAASDNTVSSDLESASTYTADLVVRFAKFAICSGSITDYRSLSQCIQHLGSQKLGQTIVDLWTSINDPNAFTNPESAATQQDQRDGDLQPSRHAHAKLPRSLVPLVIEQLGIYCRDEKRLRDVWTQLVAGAGFAGLESPTSIAEADLWAFCRALIWLGYTDEAIEWVTVGIEALGVPGGRLVLGGSSSSAGDFGGAEGDADGWVVRQMLNWLRLKGFADLEDRVISFWKPRKPHWVVDEEEE
eukprot:jgi/Hompol1/4686/HPOL_003809-RA